ncbi:MAG TPA: hypothetical protein DCM28_19990 [Phycisphaerales bacterium]|nr:hypothetical protein [Phycisphaerales bacterium]HCD32969.1 hypothetical protein [Phycisphaerales bacterium]
MPGDPLHPLALYQAAVQHPLSEAFFLARAYEENNDFKQAKILREDFCGSAAVSLGWVLTDPQRHAIAIDLDRPTIDYARQQIDAQPDNTADNVTLICDDVCRVCPPQVSAADIIASLNFSTLIFHSEETLLAYFQRTLNNLAPGGIFVMDLFGGDSAKQIGMQTRELEIDAIGTVTYHWEQRSYDPLTQRIDCRIHFTLPDGSTLDDAFVYDWRLWGIPQLMNLLRQAGFEHRQIWSDTLDEHGQPQGYYQPVSQIDAQHEWVIYLIAQKPNK